MRPSLWKRLFLMPALPSLWAEAATWRFRDVLWPLFLLMLILLGLLSGYRAWQVRTEMRRWAYQYDASHPAVVVEGGHVRVEGDEVIRFEEGGKTFLVDPKETIPLESITTAEAIVVRETQIINRRVFKTEVIEIADVQRLLSIDPLRIDSASLRAFDSRWGLRLVAGAWAFLLFFVGGKEVFGLLLYVPLAAGIAQLAARSRNGAVSYAQCLRVTFAAYSLLVVLDFVSNLAGVGPGFCLGIVLWFVLLAGLATWKALAIRPGAPVARVFE